MAIREQLVTRVYRVTRVRWVSPAPRGFRVQLVIREKPVTRVYRVTRVWLV